MTNKPSSFAFESDQMVNFDTGEAALERAVQLYWMRRDEEIADVKIVPWSASRVTRDA